MKKILLLNLCLLLLAVNQLFAQTHTVTGKVTAKEDGLPLPGVSVTVKGTTTGTQTDVNGHYSLNVPNNAQLSFSFLGYASQLLTPSGDRLDVVMTATAQQLGEVVVTGALGLTRTRNQQSYAAQQVAGDEVSKQRSNNFIDGLSGKVAGLEIRQNNTLGGSTNVVLRGTKSIYGNNQALFVIDGVPIGNENTNGSNQQSGGGGYDYGSPASDINPDDIQDVTVLKGAGATALYGSRGSNGVILITTKHPKKGLGITINSTVSMGEIDKSTFPKYQTQYGAGYGPGFYSADIFGNPNAKVVQTDADASNGSKFDPNLMVYQWDAFDPSSPNYGKATPWVAAKNDPSTFFRKPISTDQSIMITNGGENGTFKLGYTKNIENGVIPNSKLDKNLVDFAGTYNITKNLTAGASINYYNTNGTGRGGTGYDGSNSDNRNVMSGFRQWWETNVDVQELKQAYERTKSNVTWNMADPIDGNTFPAYWNNPYWVVDHNYETDSRNRYLGNVSLNYKPVPWINILGRVSLDTYSELQEERYDVGSIGLPYYSRFNHNYSETNFDLLANMDKNLSNSFNLKALLGTNIRKNNENSISASTNGGLIIPGLYSLSNTLNSPLSPVEADYNRQINGVFAGATLTWKNMLTLDATIRRDQSSTLPESNNAYYYPSVSAGFVFSELLKQWKWLSYGKLRASYAQVGSDAPIYSVFDTYIIVPPFGSNPQAVLSATKNNGDLKPEQTKSKEVGLELSFFNNRLGFDGSYYITNTFDEIMPVNVSNATGYTYKYLNAGNIQNKGFELSLNGTPIKSRNFNWKINVNFTRNRNKVTALYKDASGQEAQNLQLAGFQNGETLNAPLGGSLGTIRGTDFIYTNGQRTVGPDGQYLISNTSNQNIGNTNPDWTGGINNSFRYKNLSLSFLIDIRKGGSVFSNDLAYGLADGIYPLTAYTNDLGNPVRNTLANGGGFIRPGVTADGKPNTVRVSGNNYGDFGDGSGLLPLKEFVYDAGFIKLREAIIGYDLPGSALSKLGPVKGVTFQLIGRNLWMIHKNLPYADPEDGLSSGNLQGVQEGVYPTVRTIAFNLKLTF
ncbi:SusC/RagA family TonB-linked outer membrane protein [Mucilaginibacter sp. L3T2-6]|uniref:SusC/RagA family TonB-linked outer membrane protein n=1 Tax=Mucilaginibacter sp. L3T2-6 TaxID=3062491 RepID=UPI002676C605|nr:SusC/RagA family TonB-linked outer membrane protein [Mucilaginibacter sp. L3T2-6]MDO3644332.1 SusC/RagA family TonB-linked outer membrane protein [Mucilaginibacter sp. L3T2-6]MDV6216783.1 SusC/RagA family TonB-linked outer membrane protein [Mucilaginibacter sp. L3T2-6]